MSFRAKFFLFLVFIPFVTLVIFMTIVTTHFAEDKTTYVFESQINLLNQHAEIIKTSLDAVKSEIVKNSQLSPTWYEDWGIEGHWILKDKKYHTVYKDEKAPSLKYSQIKKLYSTNSSHFEKYNDLPLLYLKWDDSIVCLNLEEVLKYKRVADYFTFWSLDKSLNTLTKSHSEIKSNFSEIFNVRSVLDLFNGKFSDKALYIEDAKGKSHLASVKYLKPLDIYLVSTIAKSKTYRATYVFIAKAVFSLVFLIGLALLISFLLSRLFNKNISKLVNAIEAVKAGDFSFRVKVDSKDEFGQLSHFFNDLLDKISALIKQNTEKVQMEEELKVAQAVQNSLFLDKHLQIKTINIQASTQSASKCGGDWWFAFENDNKVFFIIADATGHGVAAALMTSAARSAVSLIENQPGLTPKFVMESLNKAIVKTSKGEMNMTAFVCCLDPDKGELTYSNASHEAPLVIDKNIEKISKRSIVPLIDVNSQRLGESLETTFEETTVEYSRSNLLIMYTDGMFEFVNDDGKALTEGDFYRRFIQYVKTGNYNLEQFVGTILNYHISDIFPDDVTFVQIESLDNH